MRAGAVAIVASVAIGACGSPEAGRKPEVVSSTVQQVARTARLPRAPGAFGPSLVAVTGSSADHEVTTGEMLADVDTCSTCHPDVAAQWSSSAHSFASFGNPIYRASIERIRTDLGKTPSRHCGGCHDMPLMVDGLMTSDAAIPAVDLRAHSGVTCRLCHGVQDTTMDGNGSYAWSASGLDIPSLDDAASIARHKQVTTTKLDTELCVACHRGFLSPDMTMPVHLTGIDEPGVWRSSAFTGNGLAQLDKVERQNCIDCHMERVPASVDELGAKAGAHGRTVASHRFVGGHTWMASMRNDAEQLRMTRAKLEGAASIDIAAARTGTGAWTLPADGASLRPGTRLELDVVIRNLLVGHRFPGGVLDIQDTWVELELVDRNGVRIAANGLTHATDPRDQSSHVLRTLVVDEDGAVLERHEMAEFRTQVTTKTLAPREAQAVRYAFEVPRGVQQPVTAIARLRHRSRTLLMQEEACEASKTSEGQAFQAGGQGAREIAVDPCTPQPITLVAESRIELGTGARRSTRRPAWQRMYEHGMALAALVVTRVEEARPILEAALAAAPDAQSRAMVEVQLGWVASKQGRLHDALDHVARARALVPDSKAGVFDAVVADAYVRRNLWSDALAPARACTERAPRNAGAWALYARVLVAVGDHEAAVTAASEGLELSPRDPDLLRSQATALAALKDPQARAAHEAYVRFRAPDEAQTLRIRCAQGNARCWRDRNPVQTLELR